MEVGKILIIAVISIPIVFFIINFMVSVEDKTLSGAKDINQIGSESKGKSDSAKSVLK